MQFDWNLLKPEREVSSSQASLAREIAGTFLITGIGIPDHQKRVELRKDRHLLDELLQFGFIRNIANRFYPTFPGLYLVDSPLRDTYAMALDLMFRAVKSIFEEKSYQRFNLQEVEQQFTRLLSGIRSQKLKRTVAKDAPPNRVAHFLLDFPHFVYIQEAQYPNSPVIALTCTDAMFDYEDLAQAWKHELAQRPKPAATQAAAPAKVLSEPEAPAEKCKKVFVIHGRDERLRAGVFAFLRALHLDPLEWINLIQLTNQASPYIGDVLDAAFTNAQAVVVLLSPDDEARLRLDLLQADDPASEKTFMGQARPNVLFEAGMAFGSHSNQTVLVQFGEVRAFSDIAGRHVVRMDDSIKKRQELAAKLKAAGCSVNSDGADWHTAGDLTPPTQSIATSLPHTDRAPRLPERIFNLVSLKPLSAPRRVAPDDSDTWREVGALEKGVFAAIAVFRNERANGVSARSIEGLAAQITFFEPNGGEVQRIYNGTWLGDPYNRTSLDVGDTQELLIAVSNSSLGSSFAIENTRRRAAEYETEGSREKPLERRLYDVKVRLIGRAATEGDVDNEFHFNLDLRGNTPILKRE